MLLVLTLLLGLLNGYSRPNCESYSFRTGCTIRPGARKVGRTSTRAVFRFHLTAREKEIHFDTCRVGGDGGSNLVLLVLDHNYNIIVNENWGCSRFNARIGTGTGVVARNLRPGWYMVIIYPDSDEWWNNHRTRMPYTLNMYHGSIRCNQVVRGTTGMSKTEYYKVSLPVVRYNYMNVDSCGSKFDTSMWLYTHNMRQLTTCHNDNCNQHHTGCGRLADIAVSDFVGRRKRHKRGVFFIGIGGYSRRQADYKLRFRCGRRPPNPKPPTRRPRQTTKPHTKAPVTRAPVTRAPVTKAPVTSAPVTAPVTSPTTKAPVTRAPVTRAPVTQAPVTQAPVTSAPTTKAPTQPQPCRRVRRAWHKLSAQEQNDFVEAIGRVNAQGKYQKLARAHEVGFSTCIHGSSMFLPWHRAFLYGLESMIRNLGGKWRCFGMPYWDLPYEIDEPYQPGVNRNTIALLRGALQGNNLGCLNGHLSGLRDPRSNRCIKHTPCSQNNRQQQCDFTTRSQAHDLIKNYNAYGDDSNWQNTAFREQLENNQMGYHIAGHVNIGGSMAELYSPIHPAFFLLHNFIDFTWAAWQQCHGFDRPWSGNNRQYLGTYAASHQYGPSSVNAYMPWFSLTNEAWFFTTNHGNQIRPRDIFDITAFGEGWLYNPGDMFTQAQFNGLCPNGRWNPQWFTTSNSRRRLGYGGKPQNSPRRKESGERRFGREARRMMAGKGPISGSAIHRVAEMSCIFAQESRNTVCTRPEHFRGCDDIKKRNMYGDIRVTKAFLMNRAEGSDCQMYTVERMFKYCRQTNNLLRLCNGQFTPYCTKVPHKPAPKCDAVHDAFNEGGF